MGRSKSYDVGGHHFAKQGDLEAAVKAALNSHPLNTRFHDDFLAAVINELHADVRATGQHTTGEFEYLDWGEQAKQCLALMTAEEIESRFGDSKFVLGRDELAHCIPHGHPAFRALLAAHQTNTWEWLCAYHHRGVVTLEAPQQLSLV